MNLQNESKLVLRCSNLEFKHPQGLQTILKDINLSVSAGERVALMGASGSGKTTLIKVICNFSGYHPLLGKVEKWGDTSLVFQQPLLLPNKTVCENILLPTVIQHRQGSIEHIVRILNLKNVMNRYPFQLSGGQQRRVSLARALAQPDISCLLMDEPFTGLDEPLRNTILRELLILLATTSIATLFSTHSPLEAIILADRILFLGSTPSTVIASYNVNIDREKKIELLKKTDIYREIAQELNDVTHHLQEICHAY